MRPIEQELREFVINNFLFGQGGDGLSNDDSFLEKGIIDSTGVLELVAFLEEKFQITLQDEELVPANLDSINYLVGFLQRKLLITP
jgi:acyl carrier protein